MRKPKSKVPFLHWQQRADGTWIGHWKPSPRLRALGWTNRQLGTGEHEADVLAAALALNAQVAESDAGAQAAAPARAAPRRYRFADLVAAYRASPAFAGVAASTRREYAVRLRQLEAWATGPSGATIYADQLDRAMVEDFKAALQAGGAGPFKLAALLRVLRILCNWGKPHFLAVNPTDGVAIPTPPSRTAKLAWRDVEALAAGATDPVVRLALPVAFWTMLRRNELHQLNRFHWQELHGADPRDVPALANSKGEVWGFRLQPNKTRRSTGRWVDCPVPPFLHAAIADAFATSQWLFPNASDPAKPVHPEILARRIRPVLDAGGFRDHQLRDLRRSGMSGVVDLGADRSDVFAISGHSVLGGRRTIADTYMPPDTRAAIRAIAAACRTLATMKAREGKQGQ